MDALRLSVRSGWAGGWDWGWGGGGGGGRARFSWLAAGTTGGSTATGAGAQTGAGAGAGTGAGAGAHTGALGTAATGTRWVVDAMGGEMEDERWRSRPARRDARVGMVPESWRLLAPNAVNPEEGCSLRGENSMTLIEALPCA